MSSPDYHFRVGGTGGKWEGAPRVPRRLGVKRTNSSQSSHYRSGLSLPSGETCTRRTVESPGAYPLQNRQRIDITAPKSLDQLAIDSQEGSFLTLSIVQRPASYSDLDALGKGKADKLCSRRTSKLPTLCTITIHDTTITTQRSPRRLR